MLLDSQQPASIRLYELKQTENVSFTREQVFRKLLLVEDLYKFNMQLRNCKRIKAIQACMLLLLLLQHHLPIPETQAGRPLGDWSPTKATYPETVKSGRRIFRNTNKTIWLSSKMS